MAAHVEELQVISSALRIELKAWEKKFATENNGRRAGRDDIKSNADIAAKYKEYNKIRDTNAGSIAQPESETPSKRKAPSVKNETPRKRRATPTTTPKKQQSQAEMFKAPAQTPSKKIRTPAHVRMFVGPTPQRDGQVLGLFDLLPTNTPSRTSRTALGEIEFNVAQTPSRSLNPSDSSNPLAKNGARTPMSSGKRFLLDKFATPVKPRMDEEGTPSMSRQFATPSFLRRDTIEFVGFDDTEKSPPTRTMPWKRTGLTRSLSSMIKGLKKVEEERHDDDLDILRQLEREENGEPPSQKPAPKLIVEDSQAGMKLGPDILSESEAEDPNDKESGFNPTRIWKKKGQKRQTRRYIIRPVHHTAPERSSPKPDVSGDTDAARSDIEEAGADETAKPREEGDSSGSEYASDDSHSSKVAKKRRGRPPKAVPVSQAPQAKSTENPIKKAVRKVGAQAHANYRRLKIKSKNSKGKGRPGFGRR